MYECIHMWMQNVNITQLNWFEAESSWVSIFHRIIHRKLFLQISDLPGSHGLWHPYVAMSESAD